MYALALIHSSVNTKSCRPHKKSEKNVDVRQEEYGK